MVIFELVGASYSIHVTLVYLIFSLWFMLLRMKGGSCACTPFTSMLTLHPPFEKSGYGPDMSQL